MATNNNSYFTQFLDFFSRTDVVVTVIVSLIVGALTLKYLTMNQGVQVQEVVYETTMEKKKKKKKSEKEETLDNVDTEEYDEEIVSNQSQPIEREEEGKEEEDDDEALKSNIKLLDSEDVEMIKKGATLDTKDPAAVKHYVQEMRTLSYKGKDMSDADHEREEEAKQRQLAQIYSLMNQQKDKFGETSIDDVKQQMNMYQQ